MGKNMLNAKKVSLSGILLALTAVCLYVAAIAPTGKLSFYALSSFFVSIIVIEFGVKSGWIFYFSSCLLLLLVLPNKAGALSYAMFFGIYGLIKFYIEKLNNILIEYILKILYFNVCLSIAILFIKEFFLKDVRISFPWWAVILGLQFVFVTYDYVYTLFIQYYNTRLKKIIRL